MSNQINARRNDSIDVLHSLLDVIPSPVDGTVNFKNIPHEQLSRALKFWLDQTRLCFGEVTQTEIIHGKNEAGIDIFIDLLKSPPIRFAFQVKSYEDIEDGKQSLSEKVHAQINRSHKHNLMKLVVAFAGDMTDSKQSDKINYVTSDIHQIKGDNEYVSLISPSQLLTIYNTYKNNLNPLDFINFNLGNCARLAVGLTKSMSNEKRKAKVSINLEYPKDKDEENSLRMNFTYRLKEDELKLIPRLENLSDNDEIVITKDQLQEFSVYEGDKKIFSGIEGDLILTNTPIVYLIKFQTFGDKELLYTLSDLHFSIRNENDVVKFYLMDEEQPLRIILESYNKGKMHFSFNLEDYRCDAIRLLSVLNFLKSFAKATDLKITISNGANKEFDVAIPKEMQKSFVDDSHFAFVENLAYIQEKTGYVLRLLKDSTISNKEIRTTCLVVNAIKLGKIENFDFACDIKLNRIQALNMLEDMKRGKRDFSCGYELPPFTILGREIKLGPGKIISDEVKCNEDIDSLYESISNSRDQNVDLKLEGKGECILHWFNQNLA